MFEIWQGSEVSILLFLRRNKLILLYLYNSINV